MSMRGREAARLFFVARQSTQCPNRAHLPRPSFLAQRVEIDLNSPALTTALGLVLVLASFIVLAPLAAADCARPYSALPIHDAQALPITPCPNQEPLTNLAQDAIHLPKTGDGNFADFSNMRGCQTT